MIAIVLAAGEGSRLRPHTRDRPKCLVELAGRPLLDHQLAALRAAGVERIHLVTGYRAESLRARGLPCHHNARFAETNMVASLMGAADLLDGADDVLIAYADIVYEPRIVRALLEAPGGIATTVDLAWADLWRIRGEDPLKTAETLRLGPDGTIREVGRTPASLEQIEAQYMGLIRVKAERCPDLVRLHEAMAPEGPPGAGRSRDRLDMTSFLQHAIDSGMAIHAVAVRRGWLEVDSAEDLRIYRELCASGRLAEQWRAVDPGPGGPAS